MTLAPVKLLSKSRCVQCDATKRALKDAGVEYVEISLDTDPEALDFALSLGHKAAPVVIVDENNHWSGFRPDRIAALAI